MISAKCYSITVQFGEFHGDWCYEGRVKEFPEISEYAESHAEAYYLVIDTIDIICEHYLEKGIKCPVPLIVSDSYSGRITLRLPLSLHKQLVIESESERTSLNQAIVNKLYYVQGAVDAGYEVEKNAARIAEEISQVLVTKYSGSWQVGVLEGVDSVAKTIQKYRFDPRQSARAYN